MALDSSGKSAWELDRDHFIHPYTDFSTFSTEGSQIIEEAHGVHVVDSHGRKYLDGIAGLWCVNVGHGRGEMAEAIARQVKKMSYYNPFGPTSNEPAAQLAGRLASMSPGDLNRVFFSCSGSAANDTAIRLTHYYFNRLGKPNKKKIISRMDAYHGATYLAASLTGIESTKVGFDRVPDLVHHVSAANLYRMPKWMDEAQYADFLVQEFEDRILQLGPDNVAAFIAEPIMGAGGVLVAPQGYHKRMYDICKKYDMLYISDEVILAFGRLGEMFSSHTLFDVEPDIMCLAKGITSGYVPLGATLISDAVYDTISLPSEDGPVLSMGFTYSGHAVACAAALENIDIIEREGLCEHVRQVGPHMQKKIAELSKHRIVGDVRGSHLMLGIEFVTDRANRTSFDPSVGSAAKVAKHCMERGLIVRPIGNVIVLSPPLTVTYEDIGTMVDVLDLSVAAAEKEFEQDGLLE